MRNVIILILLLSIAVLITGCTPALTGAIWRGDKEAVRTLLDKGTDVNAKGEYGSTALQTAVGKGNIDIVKMLLEKGADVNIEDNFGSAPLSIAVKDGYTEIAMILLNRGADVNVKSGITAFTSTSCDGSVCSHSEGVSGGETSLIIAAQKGNVEIVKALLNKDADLNAKDANGNTALKWAEKNNHGEVIKLLKEAKARWKPRNNIEKAQAAENVEIEEIQNKGVGNRFRIAEILPETNKGEVCSYTIKSGENPENWLLKTAYPKDTIPTRAQGGGLAGGTIIGTGSIFAPAGDISLLKSGSILRFEGKVSFKGFNFEGEESGPLTFILLDQFGFVYVTGKGKVTLKDGRLITLPTVN